jgi:hypothetical protein
MLKPYITLRKEAHELLASQRNPFERLPELSLMLPVNYQLQDELDSLVDIHQGLDDLIIKYLAPFVANKAILIPSYYEQLLVHTTENLFNMNHQLGVLIYGRCADLLRVEALQVKFIHSKKLRHTVDFKDITESQESKSSLSKDQFSALQIIAYIFLRHRKHSKAGIMLKTLHQIEQEDTNSSLSLVFVLIELGLTEEAEAILSLLEKNNEMGSPILDLLRTKLKLIKNQSKLEDTRHQPDDRSN